MSATYNPSNIAASGTDYISAVRWLIQDTDTTVAQISDEELTALYGTMPSTDSSDTRAYKTAVAAAKGLYTRYMHQASFSSGGTSVQLKERAENFRTIVADLEYKLLELQNGSAGMIYSVRYPSFTW